MIKERMTDIKRNGLVVPGGWVADFYEVEPTNNEAYEFYGALLMEMGYTEAAAMELVHSIIQHLFNAGMRHHLRMSIINFAEKYAEMYPEAVKKGDRVLRKGLRYIPSFNPEIAQHYYFPLIGDALKNRPPGIKTILDAFEEMAKDV